MTSRRAHLARADRADVSDQIQGEQIAALFRNALVGVLGGAVSAAILAAVLIDLKALTLARGCAWSLYIGLCTVAHSALRRAYDQARDRSEPPIWWARRFTAISLAEGLGWGWAALWLLPTATFGAVNMLVMAVVLSVASGSIAAFGSYLPAFWALFVPVILPYSVTSLLSTEPLRHDSAFLMIPYSIAMGALALGANRRLRELVKLRIETSALAESLGEANRAKSSFLAAASHDLRQPVHALGLFAGALRAMKLPPQALALVEQIEASSAAMDTLFSALLDISRLDAGVVSVNPQAFPIQPLLDRICLDHLGEAEAKGVVLVQSPCSAIVRTDPVLVERIVRNLVSNAVRYTTRGRVLVGCRRGVRLRVEVWDTGSGIPPERQEQVFEEYYQLGNPERDRAKGLGLGLAIVRRLTHLLGSELRLRSEPGRGSCFSVTVPVADETAVALDQGAKVQVAGLARRRVLIIDDEAAIRAGMSALLTGWGHTVLTAGSGDEMLGQLAVSSEAPDLIISDYRLRNEETGIDVIERIRSEYNDDTIPAMLITGDSAPDRLIEAQASGLVLLHKPVANSKLRASINNLIANADEAAQPIRREPIR